MNYAQNQHTNWTIQQKYWTSLFRVSPSLSISVHKRSAQHSISIYQFEPARSRLLVHTVRTICCGSLSLSKSLATYIFFRANFFVASPSSFLWSSFIHFLRRCWCCLEMLDSASSMLHSTDAYSATDLIDAQYSGLLTAYERGFIGLFWCSTIVLNMLCVHTEKEST